MRVVAINGSPKMDKGSTALILNPFLVGMRQAGAEVERYSTQKLQIKPCLGCFRCSVQTPGQCVQKDDMQMLRPRLCKADVWVLATPVYVSGMTGPLKNLLDRTLIPLGEPYTVLQDGHCHHPMRRNVGSGQVALVSSCGYWEMDNFSLLLDHMRAFCEHAERDFAEALLRPHAPAMRPMIEAGAPIDDVFEAAREAGRQLAADGERSPETLAIVGRDLVPLESWIRGAD